jgi:hypothetical protein
MDHRQDTETTDIYGIISAGAVEDFNKFYLHGYKGRRSSTCCLLQISVDIRHSVFMLMLGNDITCLGELLENLRYGLSRPSHALCITSRLVDKTFEEPEVPTPPTIDLDLSLLSAYSTRLSVQESRHVLQTPQ